MDQTDIKIMNILQEDCKTTTREIGKLVGLTAPAVSERVTRLREAGAITGFHAKLDPAQLGNRLCAYIMINVPPESYTAFCEFAEKSPMIVEHHHIIGPNNALLKVCEADAAALEQQLVKIRTFGLSQTSVVLNTYFDQKPFVLD